MREPTIAASVTSRVIGFAAERGASAACLLQSVGLDRADLDDHDGRIPIGRHVALLRAAQKMCGDPAFALHYGEAVNLAEVSVVGLLGYACETMLDAFVQLSRYSRLIMDMDAGEATRFQLVQETDGPWIVDARNRPNDYPELTEIAFAQMVAGTRQFGSGALVRAVHVTHADPGYGEEYERVLGATITFNSRRNAMRIDPSWLSHRVAQQPRYAFGILSRHADALLAKLNSGATVRGRVEEAILPILHTGSTGMERVAACLGFSRDTLHRKLKAEGTTFTHILDSLRRKLAIDYLSGGKVSVNETAYLVGFSDPAAFSRAFKRWTGRNPSALRLLGAQSRDA